MVIFDPDQGVVEKARRKFSVRIPNFDESRILSVLGDCAETLPKFLAGDFLKKKKSPKATRPSHPRERGGERKGPAKDN